MYPTMPDPEDNSKAVSNYTKAFSPYFSFNNLFFDPIIAARRIQHGLRRRWSRSSFKLKRCFIGILINLSSPVWLFPSQ